MAQRHTGRGQLVTYYTREPDGAIVSQDTGGKYYYLYDGTGRIAVQTGSSGKISDGYTYDPQGTPLTDTHDPGLSGDFNPWRAQGGYGYWNSDLSLYKTGLRYSDPGNADWTQQDIVTNPFDPRGNRYIYAADDPINLVDPTGMFPCVADLGPLGSIGDCKKAEQWSNVPAGSSTHAVKKVWNSSFGRTAQTVYHVVRCSWRLFTSHGQDPSQCQQF